MCGICGFVSKQDISVQRLKDMNDTMYHRGPDDSGEEIYDMPDGYHVGLAQRRLSILDLSASGHQPMHSNDKQISIVFNGEIYNFKELREQLRDYEFHSTCDTEVILAAYLKWGIACLEKLNGMFAICIYDRNLQEVFLARDRIGKKPLYYYYKNNNLVFASELKPIMCCPDFEKEIHTEILARYLCIQYIADPDTVFRNVYKLAPGSVLRFKGGEINTWKYWDIKSAYKAGIKEPVKDYKEAKSGLKEILGQAVADRMVADVPIGTFLSGGYDSSLISAIATEYSDTPVKTYCIGFGEKEFNEAVYAKKIAQYLGTDHTELYIAEQDMMEMVDSIADYYDEPFADSSQIPSMLVSHLAKQDVTVVLSGDGGDEFFCGYDAYEKVRQAQLFEFPGAVVGGISQLPGIKNKDIISRLPSKIQIVAGNRDAQTKTQFSTRYYMKHIYPMLLDSESQQSCLFENERKYEVRNWQIRRMLLDMETYLPADILCKVDRASMKYSLETRCPILDTRVMEYSFRIPHKFKYNKGSKKYILKDLAYDYIPKDLLERPKQGFGVPINKWLRGPLKEQLTDYADTNFLKEQGIFNPEYMQNFLKRYFDGTCGGKTDGSDYSQYVWAFFVFQMWYKKWM